jgi:uncharacterized protein DUF6350
MSPSLDLGGACPDADPADDSVADSGTLGGSTFTRVRVLTVAALGSLVTGYAAIAALLAVVVAIAPHGRFTTNGVLTAALPAWLAAHQVPLELGGLELGVLPLLPTAGMMLIAARAAAGAADRLGLAGPWQAGQAVGAIALAHGAGGLTIALAVSRASADPLAALYYPALVAGLAAAVGLSRRGGLWAAIVRQTDEVALAGLRAGAVATLLLLAAGGAVLTLALVTSMPAAVDLFGAFAPGVGDGLGLLLLSIGFVPNAMLATVGFLAGPGFSMGAVSVSPLDFAGGPVPGLPLLAALPVRAAGWWPALFALPVGIGVLIGRRLADASVDPLARLRGTAVAVGVVAVVFVVLAASAGGRVGVGPFDPVSLRPAAVSLALVALVGVPAAITAWLGGPRPVHDNPPSLLDEPTPVEDDPEDTTDPGSAADSETADPAADEDSGDEDSGDEDSG